VLRVLAAFERVVISLKLVEFGEVFPDVEQLIDERMFLVAEFQKFARPDFFNRAEHLDNQHAVIRDDGAAAFTDDVGCGTFSALQTSAM